MAQITDLRAKNILPGSRPIRDSSIPGLAIEPGSAKGHGKWILRFVSPVTGKRRDMGLGTYPSVGVAEARAGGMAARNAISQGQDPIELRKAQQKSRAERASAMDFEGAARSVFDARKAEWKNPKHTSQWINTLTTYVFPQLGQRKIADLSPQDFADVLQPIWITKAETASRVKQRCHVVMQWCWANGLVEANPLDVVDHLLPQQPGIRQRTRHQPSMPWQDLPQFVQGVLRSGPPNVTRRLLEFVILTAARSGEARAMTWDEVDLATGIWTVPAPRMKTGKIHRVPLSARAMHILAAQKADHADTDLVFPAPRGGVLSDMVLTVFLRDQKVRSSEPGRYATAHGFRSSFRDWASENGYPRDWAERALAHTIPNQAEAAYHRTDLLEQRRGMMDDWAHYLSGTARE